MDYKPGRELDALIAEKVMDLDSMDPNLRLLICGKYLDQIPNYSTDIAAAWQVVEELKSKGLMFTINSLVSSDGNNENEVLISTKREEDGYIAEGFSATAPHAICLAALAAIK